MPPDYVAQYAFYFTFQYSYSNKDKIEKNYLNIMHFISKIPKMFLFHV